MKRFKNTQALNTPTIKSQELYKWYVNYIILFLFLKVKRKKILFGNINLKNTNNMNTCFRLNVEYLKNY